MIVCVRQNLDLEGEGGSTTIRYVTKGGETVMLHRGRGGQK